MLLPWLGHSSPARIHRLPLLVWESSHYGMKRYRMVYFWWRNDFLWGLKCTTLSWSRRGSKLFSKWWSALVGRYLRRNCGVLGNATWCTSVRATPVTLIVHSRAQKFIWHAAMRWEPSMVILTGLFNSVKALDLLLSEKEWDLLQHKNVFWPVPNNTNGHI